MDQTTDTWTRLDVFQDICRRDPDKLDLDQNGNPSFYTFCVNTFFHPGGTALRLKNEGLAFLKNYYPHHIIEFDPKINKPVISSTKYMPSKHYVFLTQFCRKPYYIGSKMIIFFDEEEAFLFKLCDGDINNVKAIAPEKLK